MNAPAETIIEFPEVQPQPIPSKATLYAKLARVTGKVQRIKKNGYNDFHKYEYATATDIYDGVRDALAEENVAFLPDMVSATHEGVHTRLEFDMYFCCGDTGAVKVSRWVSEADDKGDKGINKAVTFAVKYFLIATFLIATGDIADDPDAATPPVEGKKQQRQDRPATPKNAPAIPDEYADIRAALDEVEKKVKSIEPRDIPDTIHVVLTADVKDVDKFAAWLREKFGADTILKVGASWFDMKHKTAKAPPQAAS